MMKIAINSCIGVTKYAVRVNVWILYINNPSLAIFILSAIAMSPF